MIFFYNGLCAIAIKRQIRAKKFMVWSVALEGILSGGQVVAARWRGSSSAWIALCLRTMRAITLYELRSNLFNFFKGSRMQNSGGPDYGIFSTEFKQRFFFIFFWSKMDFNLFSYFLFSNITYQGSRQKLGTILVQSASKFGV